MSILHVENFSLGFRRYDRLLRSRETTVLEDLDFCIERGEIVAMVGASGAGKSLLAHAVFGILPPNAVTSGRLLLHTTELTGKTRPELCGRAMALVPQSISHLDPMVRCRRQLGWAAARSGAPADAEALEGALTRFGLDDTAARAFPHQLSGGMARRMMLAFATAGEPDLIVADEPTSGLDPANAAVVLEHLRELADSGRGVLLITHSLAEALPFADRVVLLESGRMVGIEAAAHFAGAGEDLASPYAEALWSALPQNDFLEGIPAHA